jgi:hypothetical protein
VNPEDSTPINWDATRSEPLGPPAAPVTGPVVSYQPQYQQQYLPPPPAPNVTYVQPVARKGLTGPHAAIYITLIVVGTLVVLPVVCCLGAMVIGMIGGGAGTTSTTP